MYIKYAYYNYFENEKREAASDKRIRDFSSTKYNVNYCS